MTKIDLNKVREKRDELYEQLAVANEMRAFDSRGPEYTATHIDRITEQIAQLDKLLLTNHSS